MSKPAKLSDAMRLVLRILADAGKPLTPDAIDARATRGLAVVNTLYALLKRGLVYQCQNSELFGARPWALSQAGRELVDAGGDAE